MDVDPAPTRVRRPSPAVALAVGALVLAVVVGLFWWRPWEPAPVRPGARPTPVAQASSPAPDDQPEPLTPEQRANRERLAALVHRDTSACEFDDLGGAGGELVKLACSDVRIGGRRGWVTYTLHTDEAGARDFAGSLGVSPDGRCPADGFGPYESQGRRGLVGCLASGVFWTEDGVPVRARYGGERIPTADLYAHWQGDNRI